MTNYATVTSKTFQEIENTPNELRTNTEKYLLARFPANYRTNISKEWNMACNRLKPYFTKN